MPKSKRNKQVDLSKTKKHGLEGKKKLYEEVRSCVETYTHIFIFSVNDMRNSKIKSVREQWKHSRFFIGKNKVMAKALGINPEDEFRMNLHKIGQRLKGERGLFFSNQPVEEVLKWFSSYSEGDFARSGNRATETVTLQEGPLSQFPHNLEPYLRQLGLPTTLKKGIIHLVQDYTVCNVGDILTPETAKIVKLLGYEMAEFFIKIECVWSQDGSFSDFSFGEESKENMNQANSSVSMSTRNDLASMDVDEEEVAEPSDEMIESIIMKNRRSLMNDKLKQFENEASSNGSSEDEEMTDFVEHNTTDKEANLEKSNELSKDIVDKEVSEMIDIPATLSKENSNTNHADNIGKSSPEKAKKDDIHVEEIPELVDNSKATTNNAEDDDNGEDAKISASEVEIKNNKEEISELVEDSKIPPNDAENNDKVNAKSSELVEDSETISDEVESESSEDEDVPELVEAIYNEDTAEKNSTDEEKAKESSLKRLSLDKSALHSPVMIEKRPKFSPKMTRSAMKAKKAVSKIDKNQVGVIEESKPSQDEIQEKEQPSRGRAHKRHSTGESPIERKLRNRSIKIVKKKK